MKRTLLLFLFVVGCGGSGGGDGATAPTSGGGGNTDLNCVPQGTDIVEFAELKSQVFDVSCVGCHAANGVFNPGSFAEAKARVNKINSDVSTGRMPKAPAPALTAEQKNLVAAWVNVGAPETIDDVKFCD